MYVLQILSYLPTYIKIYFVLSNIDLGLMIGTQFLGGFVTLSFLGIFHLRLGVITYF